MTKAAAQPEAMLPRGFTVVDHSWDTADTATLTLEPEEGQKLAFSPGQFTMVYAFGVGEAPISIAGGLRPDEPLMHTVRVVGQVTNAICATRPGETLGIRGPYGVGWPMEEAKGKDVVIVAGGIGLAPLRALVNYTFDNRDDFGSVSLVYGTRSPAELLYEEELRYWRSRFSIEVEVTVDRGDERWHGDIGLVTNLLPRLKFDPAKTVAMVCGPEIMMKVVARELGGLGMSRSNVYVSLERNMKCAIGFCGHCQFGADFICKRGPVVPYRDIEEAMMVEEL